MQYLVCVPELQSLLSDVVSACLHQQLQQWPTVRLIVGRTMNRGLPMLIAVQNITTCVKNYEASFCFGMNVFQLYADKCVALYMYFLSYAILYPHSVYS